MSTENKTALKNIFLRMHPLQRILLSLIITAATYFIIKGKFSGLISFILLWDIFSLSYLIFSWIVITKRSIPEIKKMAKQNDGSTLFVFLLIVISSLAGLITVLLLMLSQANASSRHVLYVPVTIAGMMLSWLMVHSTYAFHYAHMYYDKDENEPGKEAYGLEFPGDKEPNYIDFAYFAFVIGCTFQVSDVEISSPKIRQVALFHGLLSFGLNTFVIALTINLIAGLSK
jgi:uncharacterized membrane protein